jgi:hypothetical protein
MNTKVGNLYPNKPIGTDQRLTVDSTAGGVQLSAFDASADYVVWDVQTADVMVTFDGSAPTTTNGHQLRVGQCGTWSVATATAMKAIRLTGTSGVIHATTFTD